MSTTLIAIVVLGLSTLLCGGAVFVLFLVVLVVGIVVLRRRGKKVTPKAAMKQGAASVSQVFMRTGKGLEAVDEDDDDE